MEYSSRLNSRVSAKMAPYAASSIEIDDSNLWASVHSDLNLARWMKANLLIVGRKPIVSLLSLLVPDLHPVVVIQRQQERLALPPASSQVRTAIVRDVDGLTYREQRRLLDWMLDASPNRMQVISTASTPLLPMIEAGTFDEGLYYRLNTVYIDLSN